MPLQKKKNIFKSNRTALFFFAYSVLYSVVFVNRFVPWEVDDYAIYSFYAVDFSYGFATKLLPGAVFNALFGAHATRTAATVFVSAVMLLFFAGMAVLLQKFLARMPEDNRGTAFFLVLFYLSGPYTFAVFTKTLGILDTFWIVPALLFFFLIGRRRLRFLIPLLFAAAAFVHNGFVISYVILMAVALLLKASLSEERAERRSLLAVFAASVAVTVGVTVFFALFETKLICSMEEFHRKLLAHGSDCFYYYDYAFFDVYNGEPYIPDFVQSVDSAPLRFLYSVWYRIKLNGRVLMSRDLIHPLSAICGAAVLTPAVYLLIRFHIAGVKKKGNALGRLCSLLMAVQFPFTLCAGLLFSEDITRWMTHAFLVAFSLLLAALYYDPERRQAFWERFAPVADSPAAKICFLAYATLSVYTVY